MPLAPNASLGLGLATAGVVFAIHNVATPSIADIRVADPNDAHIDRSERAATWASIGVVSAVSLIAKDQTIFVIGGGMALVLAWWKRHANAVNPLTAVASMEGAQRVDLSAVEESTDSIAEADDFAA